jgi:hypothetical protein
MNLKLVENKGKYLRLLIELSRFHADPFDTLLPTLPKLATSTLRKLLIHSSHLIN